MLIESELVALRPYKDSDNLALTAILTDPSVMALAVEDRAFSPKEADTFLRAHFNQAGTIGFGSVCLKTTDEPLGFAGYRTCSYLGLEDVEFGWVIGRAHHGRGYATALGRALIAHALSSAGFNLPRVLAACHPANAPSEHILRDKLNMTFRHEVEVGQSRRRRVYVAEQPV